jgi:hypothetical protein
MKVLFGLFLIAHGLIHGSYLTPKPEDPAYPFSFAQSWFSQLVGSVARPVGLVLTITAIIFLVTAGLGFLGISGLAVIWKILLGIGVISSLLVLVLFWHPWLALGIVIDVVLLYGTFFGKWSLMSMQ